MNQKTTKIISVVLLLVSTIYGQILLMQREQSLAYFLTAEANEANVFLCIAALPVIMAILVACLLMLVYFWGNHEAARKAAYLCLVSEGVISLLSNLAYTVMLEGLISMLSYIAGNVAAIAAGVFLIASIRKCTMQWIILISLCCAVCMIGSLEALLLEVPFIAACVLSNVYMPVEKQA